jgi:hypothetical protein
MQPYRALAAILLRGITLREADLWRSLSQEEFAAARSEMLGALAEERLPFIQRKIVDSVAIHCKLAEWPELMDAVVAMQASADAGWKLISLHLIDKLAEYVGKFLVSGSNFTVTLSVISAGMELKDVSIQSSAYLALCSVMYEIDAVDGTVQKHLTALPAFMATLNSYNDDSGIVDITTAISRLLREKAAFIARIASPLLEVSLLMSSNHDLEESARIAAIDICTALLTNSATSRMCSTPQSRQHLLDALIKIIVDIDDDEGGIQLLSKPESGQGFGDVDADGDDNMEELASMCLSTVSECFSSSEMVQYSLRTAGSLVQQSDWRARRASYFLVSTICDSCRDTLVGYLPMLIDTAVKGLADNHPRVRFSAVHCMSVIVEVFSVPDEEEDDDDNNPVNFQEQSHYIIVANMFACIAANMSYPRIVYMCLYTMRLFFNPETCSKEACANYSAVIIDSCVGMLRDPHTVSFVKEELASLIANTCILSESSFVESRYPTIMQSILEIIQLHSAGLDRWWVMMRIEEGGKFCSSDLARLKGKCLECFALVGKAVGTERFLNDGLTMLNSLVAAQQPGSGLDISDVLTSYVMQACARIAGVIQLHFAAYMPTVLPLVITTVSTSIDIEVSDGDIHSAAMSQAQQQNQETSSSTFQIYKRGVGEVQITCDTNQITDKEMACRVLFQYCLDVPALVLPYVGNIVDAVVPNIASAQLSETLASICGHILSECVKIFVNYGKGFSCSALQMMPKQGTSSATATDASFSAMCNICIASLTEGLSTAQLFKSAQTQATASGAIFLDILDSTRELLRHIWDHHHLLGRSPCALNQSALKDLMTCLRDEVVVLTKRLCSDTSTDVS